MLCPFCGGEPEIINRSVHCNSPKCEAQPYTAGPTQGAAVAAWNRRPGSAPSAEGFAPLDGAEAVKVAYARHKYAQGTRECIAFWRGAQWGAEASKEQK